MVTKINQNDALGNPIVIGNTYGYTVERNGFTTVSTGIADYVNEHTGTTRINVISRKKCVYTFEPADKKIRAKYVFIKTIKLFPIK